MALVPAASIPASYQDIADAVPDLVAEVSVDLETMQLRKGCVPFTQDRQVKCLMFLAKFGLAMRACSYAGVSFETVRKFRKENLAFQEAWDQALEIFREGLESEALRRALDGWDEPVYQKGELVGTIHRHSEKMMEMLLKANIPEKYRENIKLDANISTGGVLIVPQPLSHEEWVAKYGDTESGRLPITIDGEVS